MDNKEFVEKGVVAVGLLYAVMLPIRAKTKYKASLSEKIWIFLLLPLMLVMMPIWVSTFPAGTRQGF